MDENYLRNIGFKVVQRHRLQKVKRKWYAPAKMEAVPFDYDIYKWDGSEWVAFPVVNL